MKQFLPCKSLHSVRVFGMERNTSNRKQTMSSVRRLKKPWFENPKGGEFDSTGVIMKDFLKEEVLEDIC